MDFVSLVEVSSKASDIAVEGVVNTLTLIWVGFSPLPCLKVVRIMLET